MARFFNLLPWRRRRLERDLERELRYHLDRRVEDLKQSGASDGEARRRAGLELGGVVQVRENVRDAWIWRWLDTGLRDLRYAVRMLLRSPALTVTATLSLALGIGANTAIFSLLDRVLLRSLNVPDADRIVHLAWIGNSLSNSWGTGHLVSYPLCRDLDAHRELFDGVICRHPTSVNFATGDQHQSVPAEIVSGSYFSVLGTRPAAGRLFDGSDDLQPGAHPFVVLSYGYWKNNLGGTPDIVGRTALLNNHPVTVIGVAPERFAGVDPLAAPAVWIPAMMKKQATPEWDRLLDRRAAWMHAFARLKPGTTPEQARAGLQPWFKAMLDEDTRWEGFPNASPDQRRGFLASSIDVRPASRGLSDARLALERPLLVLLSGTIILVVLSSLNVAGLLLARGAARSREFATRVALGASRRRLTGQLLIESLAIAMAGGLLGLAIAPSVARTLLTYLPADANLPTDIDVRVFLFALLASLATGVLCGLAPAWQVSRRPLALPIQERSSGGGSSAVRFRKAIVVTQLAFTLVLLMGAGLLVQTLARLHAKDLGFVPTNVVMFRAEPDEIGYSPSDAPRFMDLLLARLRRLPAVEHAAIANSHLLGGGSPRRVLTIDADRRVVTDRALPIMRVGPAFFATLGTPVIAGREFTDEDTRDLDKTGFRSVIVNESFARRYFGSRNPIGQRVGQGNQPDTITNIEIVGLIRDINFRFVRDDLEREHVFFPFARTGPLAGNGTFYVKVRGEPAAALAAIRTAARDLDPRLPLQSLTTLDDRIDLALRSEWMLATLSSSFGVMALLLSVVGLFGVVSFVVTRRTQEIGIRLALGATRHAAMWLIVRDALQMLAIGTVVALPAAWMLRRFIEAELFGVRAFDGPTAAAAVGLLALVGLGAALIPAWRAATVNPADALRFD